jgi:hypothetical protein
VLSPEQALEKLLNRPVPDVVPSDNVVESSKRICEQRV